MYHLTFIIRMEPAACCQNSNSGNHQQESETGISNRNQKRVSAAEEDSFTKDMEVCAGAPQAEPENNGRSEKRRTIMKKTYKIEVDCANCANKMEEAAKMTPGVKDAVVNFMALKMKVEFDEGADVDAVMQKVVENCKIVEDDCKIYL